MILLTRDSKHKIRVVEIDYEWSDEQRGYVIHRKTYQYGGKVTIQPEIWIYKGKVKRTVTEQAKLEFNSHVKKYTDKGYKELPDNININDAQAVEQFINEVMPDGVTDSNGFRKHMLAKQHDKVANSVFDKLEYWYGSRKIDGVRLSLYWKDGVIETASRGGGNYNYSTTHITEHPKLIEWFKNHPDIILDGELYKHGKSLQQISGAARLEKNAYSCNWLEFYIYDIMDSSKTFEERLEVLDTIQSDLNLGFNPEREWANGELKLQMVPHEKVSGWLAIEHLHNKYVKEGWEGLVIRNPQRPYKFGGRTNDMIKVKMYQDDEFEITGISEGLRDEDMCFTCRTKDGIEFKAKPMGSREVKQQYREDLDQLIGKMATVKYFYLSDEGTPLQPVLKCIRDYE